MTRRQGRPLEAVLTMVAENLIDVGPNSVYLWLLRTARGASVDRSIYTQARFGASLGKDGSFVSHIEAGDRKMPRDLRQRWFDAIDLDLASVDEYLLDLADGPRPHGGEDWARHEDHHRDRGLLDVALDGESLTPQEWIAACQATAGLGMPRAERRFVRLMTEALATVDSSQYGPMATAMQQLPAPSLVVAISEVVEDLPTRGYQLIDILAGLSGQHSGPLLRRFLRNPPDPWMLRSVAEATRRLVCRDEITHLADDPSELQGWLLESMRDAPSWTSRIELANLAAAIGPLPVPLSRRLARDHDQDVRLTVGEPPTPATAEVVRHLREEVIVPTFDSWAGSATEDPLAKKLVTLMVTGCTRRARIMAARALGLSAYRHALANALPALLSAESLEVRRTIAQAMMYFPVTQTGIQALIRCGHEDHDADIRARAIWSLIPWATQIHTDTLDIYLTDHDESARRCAVDLAGAATYETGLQQATTDRSAEIAANAATLLASTHRGK